MSGSIANDAALPPAPPGDGDGVQVRRNSRVGLAVLAILGLWAALGGGVALVVVIVAVVAMIFLHELGHFVMAKAAGMKVTEFFIGFGPRIWSFQRGETEYGIKVLPLGAYVKIIGMTRLDPVEPGDEDRTYYSKPYWRRFSVAVAGSTMHFIIAFVGLWAILTFSGGVGGTLFPKDVNKDPTYHVKVVADGDSHPAKDAGMQDGDRIVSIAGQAVADFDAARGIIRSHPDQTVPVTVVRNGTNVSLSVHLGRNPSDNTVGYLGVSPDVTVTKENALVALPLAGRDFGRGMVEVFKGLGQALSPHSLGNILGDVAHGTPSNQTATSGSGSASAGSSGAGAGSDAQTGRPVSIVGAVFGGAQITREDGWVGLAFFLVEINLFIGLFNLLPTLPFDGGHVAIATYEKIRSLGRQGQPYYADITKLMPVVYGVFAVVLVFGLSLMYLDLLQQVKN